MRALAIVALCTSAAHAQPAVSAGPQVIPPVATVGDPSLSQDPDGRRAVRGCSIDEDCGRPRDVLHQFDVEAFPPAGGTPWIDERVTGSRVEPAQVRHVKKPSELRPDQAWLDKLETPDFPFTWSTQLIDYLLFYKSDPRGRSIMGAWIERQGRYQNLIVSHLRKAHLPEDLQYDAMIESSYDVDDMSSAGALGLWQFMKAAGSIYGLRQDRWVDERMDPLRSTVAQMDYYADLYQRFGNWEIALAAFNVGYGAMLRSIARYNTNDFYQLCAYENGLPWETCLYTPKILAAAIVGRNKAAFGYDTIKQQPAEVWDEVTVPTSMTLSVIARASGANEADIKKLNPHLKRDRTPPGETGYVVRIPQGAKADFQRKLVELQTEWDGYDAYVVAHGERLEDVATTYGISLPALRKLNGIARESEIEGGTVIVVPRITEDAREKNKAKAKAKLVASGVDHKEGDETLIVPVPDKDFTIAGKQRVFYRVVSGDNLDGIAKAFGVKTAQLVEWNGLDEGGKLHPRMVLQAFVAQDFDADKHKIALLDESLIEVVTRGSSEHLDLAEERTGRVRTEYISKGNEKLEEVAKRYGMGSHDLARINRISYKTVLEKGQKIIVYQVADPTRSDRAEEQWKKTPKARRGKTGAKTPPRTSEGPVTKPGQLDEADNQ
ncbi:MAG TPA: LysM peptidoglycan-binding domain-containing protein [Kofleriaceae bacterium]|nr:LysM peptidoglycan-binding domain-containing protein [Kofleriaceae bacterium]